MFINNKFINIPESMSKIPATRTVMVLRPYKSFNFTEIT